MPATFTQKQQLEQAAVWVEGSTSAQILKTVRGMYKKNWVIDW